MVKKDRNFLIFSNHRRIQRLWQFIFTGWGLVLIIVLIAGSMISKNIQLLPISGINMSDVIQNQFKMTAPAFSGTDANGQPFSISADSAHQEYNTPNFVFMDNIRAKVIRIVDNKKITDNISARNGKYDKIKKSITLTGNVRVNSSNGDKILTNELVVKL
jgi:lipopolysaccharide export system protein LptC